MLSALHKQSHRILKKKKKNPRENYKYNLHFTGGVMKVPTG